MSIDLNTRQDIPEQASFEQACLMRGILAVTAATGDDLDQWGRGFARYVRSRRRLALEIYLPSTREALIDRFNEILKALSLERARAAPPAESAGRFILVPDIRAFDSPEGHLLARLVSDFPGAGTRLVLLIDPSEWARSQPLLSALGRQVQRIDLSAQDGSDRDTIHREIERGPQSDLESKGEVIHGRLGHVASEQPTIALQTSRRRPFSWLGAGALVTALLLVSALIVVLLHRERGPGPSFEPRSGVWLSIEPGPSARTIGHFLT